MYISCQHSLIPLTLLQVKKLTLYSDRQYQKNEGSENPTNEYQIEAILYDGNGKPIGGSGFVPAPNGQPVPVSGLVSPFTITAGPIDSSPLTIKFNGVTFNSDLQPQCSVGAYDSGNRNMDCGFQC